MPVSVPVSVTIPATQSNKSRLRYIQAEDALSHLLETGGYRPGDQLPPEPELARQLGVSRATLREALRSYEQQGIISRRQGVGTFLNPRHLYVESGLEVLVSIEDLLASHSALTSLIRRSVSTHSSSVFTVCSRGDSAVDADTQKNAPHNVRATLKNLFAAMEFL